MISVVYILRDAEKYIEASLESIKDLADEIVCVIDTRTKDNTAKVCARYVPVFVYEYDWRGYAMARNYGINKAQGDWIFILDADETVGEKAVLQIKELIKLDKDIWSMIQLGKNGQMCRTHRLFKSYLGIYYSGDIHETLNIQDYNVGDSDIVIDHHKEETPQEHIDKMNRIIESVEGLDESIKKDYYKGIFYVHTGNHGEGMKCLNRVISAVPNSLKAFIMLYVGSLYQGIAKMYETEALALFYESIKTVPVQNYGYVLLSNYYKAHGETEKADEYLKRVAGLKTCMQNDILKIN